MQRRHFIGALPIGLAATAIPAAMADPPPTPISRGSVFAIDFGVLADGTSDDSAAMTRAIDYCIINELELILPSGNIVLNSGLTIEPINGRDAIKISGIDAGTQGSRLCIKANAPALTIKCQCTLENFGIIGDAVSLDEDGQAGTRAQQDGVLLYGIRPDENGKNLGIGNIYLRNIVFEGCNNSIHIYGIVFYSYFENIRWFTCLNAHVNGAGPSTDLPGYAVQFWQCQMTAARGKYGFYLENAGSVVLSDCMISPAKLTENCFRLVSNATHSGIHQISNTVFEGSVKEALFIDGGGTNGQPKPCRFMYFSNCYFNQSGETADAITLYNAEHLYFSNCYISGTKAGITFRQRAKRISLINCEFQLGGDPPEHAIRTLPGAAVHGLDIVAPNYDGNQRFLELGHAAVGEISRIHVSGGTLGVNPVPVNCQPQDANKVMIHNTNNTQTRNGGVAVFGGGGQSTYAIPHGLLGTPAKFGVVPNSAAAGDAEIRLVQVDGSYVHVQCKNPGNGDIRWAWHAET
ncbi:hypothetical protein [Lysobacter sp. ESA13C]|uniref:hypothetical protein n=1 Tax=Lysobacter sp. ESA13C TaxID=2862676 RepID=UPI001CBCC41A|nr:hypothetical protein [Lysobacter sp. ESA13C]